tara:strand:- start:150 stop:611 length:462 start_codon:yes stop_codon:yes gene_type:complete
MTHLEINHQAPFFSGINQNGNKLTLSDFTDSKLILFFYPKDNTPGCTAESCNLNDNYSQLLDAGFKIIGVSPDNESSHLKFIEKYNLKFNLIADTDKKISSDYGVWGPKKFMGRNYLGIHRTTFVINKNQLIERIFTKVITKNHTEQILESYK